MHNITTRMSTSTETPTETTRFTIDLEALLTTDELASFLARAAKAGRTPEQHFRALTLGEHLTAA